MTIIAAGCGGSRAPSDDPFAYQVDSSVDYEVRASEPRWVVPSEALPKGIEPAASNNNVAIELFEDRLFFAWRTNDVHFAGPGVRLHVISSADGGETWELEHEVFLATDMREPNLFSFAGHLYLTFFEAGDFPGV